MNSIMIPPELFPHVVHTTAVLYRHKTNKPGGREGRGISSHTAWMLHESYCDGLGPVPYIIHLTYIYKHALPRNPRGRTEDIGQNFALWGDCTTPHSSIPGEAKFGRVAGLFFDFAERNPRIEVVTRLRENAEP